MKPFKVACIQTNSGPDIEKNLKAVDKLIRAAAKKGAKFITTPENVSEMRAPKNKLKLALPQDSHPAIPFFSDLSKELGIYLQAGSIPVKVGNKLANRSFVFNDKGKIAATYDKIHMFDVELAKGESYKESREVNPGKEAVLVKLPAAKLGLSICYDLRFAYLFRALAQRGASIITVPAAFTVPTGKAHWEILLRARAIETGCFILAPGQTGTHEEGQKTWGHSMIVNPWGAVIDSLGVEPGILVADLNMEEVAKARASVPALKNDRTFTGP